MESPALRCINLSLHAEECRRIARPQTAPFGSAHNGAMIDASTSPQGLSNAEARERIALHGANELPAEGRRALWRLAIAVIGEPMFLLLSACAFVYWLLGEPREGMMLAVAIVFMMAITFVQEHRTETALAALRVMSAPEAVVLRDGCEARIPARELVPGDLIKLREGDRVPADAMLVGGNNIAVDESLLTGESVAVRKQIAAAESTAGSAVVMGQPGGDDLPWMYSGSLIVQGSGLAKVMATGRNTAIGNIGGALAGIDAEPTRIQRETRRIVRRLAAASLVTSMLLAVYYGATRGDWLTGALAGLTLAMSALPEELPVVLVIFLSIGAWRIARQGVLTRQMPAIEMLGAVTVLCVDKTGTLTENRMTVSELSVGNERIVLPPLGGALPEAFHRTLEYGMLASHRDPFDPMERAILGSGGTLLAGSEHIHRDWKLVSEYPLSPGMLAMSRVWRSPDLRDYVIAAKGAPEAIASLCHLDAAGEAAMAAEVTRMASRGLRVLAVAHASFSAVPQLPTIQHEFDFALCGLIGLADPVRAGVVEAIRECRGAGVRIVMITGDYPVTALEIARQAGLDTQAGALTGAAFAELDDAALAQAAHKVNVFCRMMPAQKLRLVEAFKASGDIVAMTGDGVNDAPALKAAHVGIAMARGTDVAREAASLVLQDDNFTAIVATIRAGRRIFDNLRKAFAFLVAVHLPIVGMALIPAAMGMPLVFLPAHIMFLELVIDPVCSIVFEMEGADARAMMRPPRPPGESLFDAGTVWLGVAQGVALLAAVLCVHLWSWHGSGSPEVARAAAFATLVVATLVLILANRARTASAWSALFRHNIAFWLIGVVTSAILVAVLFIPALSGLFHFAPLNTRAWSAIALAVTGTAMAFEAIRRVAASRLS